jgi:ribosome-binding protein aMBF1 (putative translation factor)
MTSANAVPSDSDEPGSGGREEPVLPDSGGLVRAARRRADLSRRELAAEAGMAHSTVGRIEAGTLVPSLATLTRLVAVAGLRLVLIDVPPPPTVEQWLRRHPDHRRPGHGTH